MACAHLPLAACRRIDTTPETVLFAESLAAGRVRGRDAPLPLRVEAASATSAAQSARLLRCLDDGRLRLRPRLQLRPSARDHGEIRAAFKLSVHLVVAAAGETLCLVSGK